MARLAIAKKFLTDYSKLEKSVQNSVQDAIGKFSEHTYAGLHLEKLHSSRDRHMRTIRIDNFWRGIVLAPDQGDTYCLITVLPHDKANAYASSHRFTVNEALGVLEVRDEGALEELHPSLQAIAETADRRLFADVSDADLQRLGVDAQILPVIRLLAAETDLEAMQSMLPEAQYAALLALACGMTVDEAWAEVAQYLPDQAQPQDVDPDDIVAAMRRTPAEVTFVSSSEELQAILERPFAAWRVFLHPGQRRIATELSFSGPAQVTGGAGTGKTVTALHRAAHLAAQLDGVPHGRHPILLTSFTRNVVDSLDAQLSLLMPNRGQRDLVEVLNVDRLAFRVVHGARGDRLDVARPRELRRRWAIPAAGLPFTPMFLQHEWEEVILAQDLRSEHAYLTCLRTGRGSPLGKAQRRQVWNAAQRAAAELQAAGQTTHIQLADEAATALRASGPVYQHVIVDEAQDLHPAQWRLLRAAVAPGPNDIFIAGDPHQRIYDHHVSLTRLSIAVRGRSRRLTVNYRTTQEILAWAVPLLGSEPVTGLDDQVDSLVGYRSPSHGRRPEIRGAAAREDELAILAERIRTWLGSGIEPHAIGVAARSSQLVRRARDALEAASIRSAPLGSRGPASAVRVGTMHGMKGLEFRAVAVIGAEDGTVPSSAALTPAAEDRLAHAQDLLRERCVLFVACTRARDYLHVSYTGQPSPFLADQPGGP